MVSIFKNHVFRVPELDGDTDDPKADAKAQVLEDYRLEKDSTSEMVIQKQFFRDIAEFAKSDWRECVYSSLQKDAIPTTQYLTQPHPSAGRDPQTRRVDEPPQEVVYKNCMHRPILILDDKYASVHCLPTIRDAFSVLFDCVTALHLMFCAGWVYHDVSCNNIMAIHDPETRR